MIYINEWYGIVKCEFLLKLIDYYKVLVLYVFVYKKYF